MKRIFTSIAIAAMLLIASLGFAIAQEVLVETDAVSPASWLHSTWEVVQPIVLTLVTASAPLIVAGILGFLWKALERIGISVEEDNRKRLHDAALNGLLAAIAKHKGPIPNMIDGPVPQILIDEAIDYIKSKNPDTSKGVSDKNLVDIILSKVPDAQMKVTAGQATAAPTVLG